MSYDISFRVQVKDTDVFIPVGECSANITWNVRQIITESTGLDWDNEENNGLCKDVIPYIAKGLSELLSNPEKYKQYESPNGWGTIGGTIHFFQTILEDWNSFQMYYPELIDHATFWIL